MQFIVYKITRRPALSCSCVIITLDLEKTTYPAFYRFADPLHRLPVSLATFKYRCLLQVQANQSIQHMHFPMTENWPTKHSLNTE